MNKPNWKDAPDWANWLAQDYYGYWHWFEEKPHPHRFFWRVASGLQIEAGLSEPVHKWHENREPRPTIVTRD